MELLNTVLEVLKSLVTIIPSIAILAAEIYYIAKRSTPDGYLMAAGSLIGLLVQLFYSVAMPLLVRSEGVDFYSSYQAYFTLIGIISTIGAILFAIGFILLIHKFVKTPVATNTSGPSGY